MLTTEDTKEHRERQNQNLNAEVAEEEAEGIHEISRDLGAVSGLNAEC
jgi:hypothetical protein